MNFFEQIRQTNPDRPIILICDNFSSHFANYIDELVEELNIRRVALPKYSPDLNPIEQIWDPLKRALSPRDLPDRETFQNLIEQLFTSYASRLSFAQSWIEQFLDVQKICP